VAPGDRVDLDLNFPARVKQPGDDDHGGSGPSGRKALGVGRPDKLGVASRGDVHASPDYVGKACSQVGKSRSNDVETASCL
jgi:hypothetical protein